MDSVAIERILWNETEISSQQTHFSVAFVCVNSSERHFYVQYSVFSAFSMGISIQWMLYRNLFNVYIVLPSTLHCLYIINKFIEQKTRTLLSEHQKKECEIVCEKAPLTWRVSDHGAPTKSNWILWN